MGCGVAVKTVTRSGAWKRCQCPCGTTISIPERSAKDCEPAVRHDGQRRRPVQNMHELITVPMALPGTVSGKASGKDAAITEGSQDGEGRLRF